MCYLPPTKRARPIEVQVPSMASVNLNALKLYHTKMLAKAQLDTALLEPELELELEDQRPIFQRIEVPKIVIPRLMPTIDISHHATARSPSLDSLDIFYQPAQINNVGDTDSFLSSPFLDSRESNHRHHQQFTALSGPYISFPSRAGRSASFSSPPSSIRTRSSSPGIGHYITSPLTPLSSIPLTPKNGDDTLQDDDLAVTGALEEDTETDGLDPENAWNLVPYHIPWGSHYHGYKAGTLPGPDGKCIFLRSPTPLKNQRTGQACEKCRERKAKCSGSRPACARCIARGHVCEYGPEVKRPRTEGSVKEEEEEDPPTSPDDSRSEYDSPVAPRHRVRSTGEKLRRNTVSTPRSCTTTSPTCTVPASRRHTITETSSLRATLHPPTKRRCTFMQDRQTDSDNVVPGQVSTVPISSVGIFSSVTSDVQVNSTDDTSTSLTFATGIRPTSSEASGLESFASRIQAPIPTSLVHPQQIYSLAAGDLGDFVGDLSKDTQVLFRFPESACQKAPVIEEVPVDSFLVDMESHLTQTILPNFSVQGLASVPLPIDPQPLYDPSIYDLPRAFQMPRPQDSTDNVLFEPNSSSNDGSASTATIDNESSRNALNNEFNFPGVSPIYMNQPGFWASSFSSPSLSLQVENSQAQINDIPSANSTSCLPFINTLDEAPLISDIGSLPWATSNEELRLSVAPEFNPVPLTVIRGPAAFFEHKEVQSQSQTTAQASSSEAGLKSEET